MASSFKQLRRTAVSAIADPDSFKASMSQKLKLGRGPAPSPASPVTGDPSPSQASPVTGVVDPKSRKAFLDAKIKQRKSDMPLRLICTEDGKLYDVNAIETLIRAEQPMFCDSTALCPDAEIDEAVETSFAYAMFSHRWSAAEPVYKDLDSSDVFSLAESLGTRKLKHFCRNARERGFRWAWSDTCCIDKTSTAELQKSISSMFKWYKKSGLTIVHLGDVFDDSVEALEKSVWFLRGWTLQELIAPDRLLFFKADWTLLATSVDLPIDNYKDSPTFRELITRITGIEDDALTKFDPVNCKITLQKRMSWAARRETTEIEDTAYCLMGIFNVHFPVMYGEGESAFTRLQNEIMAASDDPSLFDWTGQPGAISFLASSPGCFEPETEMAIKPFPLTLRLAEALKKMDKLGVLQKTQRGIDNLTAATFNLQERFSTNAQHPANYVAGAKVHCHGLEYCVLDVEETKAMMEAHEAGNTDVFQYHIIAESLHPITVNLTEKIETGFGFGRLQSRYLCIFRVWDQSLATEEWKQSGEDHPLRQPFVAHLLVAEPGGVYRRIQVKERKPIIAQLDQTVEFRLLLQVRTLMVK